MSCFKGHDPLHVRFRIRVSLKLESVRQVRSKTTRASSTRAPCHVVTLLYRPIVLAGNNSTFTPPLQTDFSRGPKTLSLAFGRVTGECNGFKLVGFDCRASGWIGLWKFRVNQPKQVGWKSVSIVSLWTAHSRQIKNGFGEAHQRSRAQSRAEIDKLLVVVAVQLQIFESHGR